MGRAATQVMVAGAAAHPAATPEPDVIVDRDCPTGEIAPRRGNVHDVGRTVTHVRLIVVASVTGTEGDPPGLARH